MAIYGTIFAVYILKKVKNVAFWQGLLTIKTVSGMFTIIAIATLIATAVFNLI